MKTAIKGVNLAYDDAGKGHVVVLLHGFPLCRRMWHPQMEFLVKAGYRVILPDLRGFGESEAPEGLYSMNCFADDIIGLLNHLEVGKAVIGGMSMGGYVLLNLLERYPQQIAAAAFIVTRSDGDDEAGKARRTTLAKSVQKGQPQIVSEAFEKILFAEETPKLKPDLVEEVKGWMSIADPRGLAGGLLAIRDRKDYVSDLENFNLPALVIRAEQDQAIPPENSDILAQGLPQSRLYSISRGGHMVNLEQPEAFNQGLLEFLSGLELP